MNGKSSSRGHPHQNAQLRLVSCESFVSGAIHHPNRTCHSSYCCEGLRHLQEEAALASDAAAADALDPPPLAEIVFDELAITVSCGGEGGVGTVVVDGLGCVNEVQVWRHEHVYGAALEKDEFIGSAPAMKEHLVRRHL